MGPSLANCVRWTRALRSGRPMEALRFAHREFPHSASDSNDIRPYQTKVGIRLQSRYALFRAHAIERSVPAPNRVRCPCAQTVAQPLDGLLATDVRCRLGSRNAKLHRLSLDVRVAHERV